jgi:hypothetical protein
MPSSPRRPLVLVLPGVHYGQQAPLLWWARSVAEGHGAEVVAPSWTVDAAAAADPVGFVEAAVHTALSSRLPDLVIAKSFGCAALPWAVRHGIDGVWMTPVSTRPEIAGALRALGPGSVAVGGSADPLWRPDDVGATGARLHTLDGADHALEVSGDWRRSQRLQETVLDIVDARIAAIT